MLDCLIFRVGRQRLDLGAANGVVGAVVADHLVVDFLVGIAESFVDLDATEVARVKVVGPHRAEHNVPDESWRRCPGSFASISGKRLTRQHIPATKDDWARAGPARNISRSLPCMVAANRFDRSG